MMRGGLLIVLLGLSGCKKSPKHEPWVVDEVKCKDSKAPVGYMGGPACVSALTEYLLARRDDERIISIVPVTASTPGSQYEVSTDRLLVIQTITDDERFPRAKDLVGRLVPCGTDEATDPNSCRGTIAAAKLEKVSFWIPITYVTKDKVGTFHLIRVGPSDLLEPTQPGR